MKHTSFGVWTLVVCWAALLSLPPCHSFPRYQTQNVSCNHDTKLVWTPGYNEFRLQTSFGAGVTCSQGVAFGGVRVSEVQFVSSGVDVGNFHGTITACFAPFMQRFDCTNGQGVLLHFSCVNDSTTDPYCMRWNNEDLEHRVVGPTGTLFASQWNNFTPAQNYVCTAGSVAGVYLQATGQFTSNPRVGSIRLDSVAAMGPVLLKVVCQRASVEPVEAYVFAQVAFSSSGSPSSSAGGALSSSGGTAMSSSGMIQGGDSAFPCCPFFQPAAPAIFQVGQLSYVNVNWEFRTSSPPLWSVVIAPGTPLPPGLALAGRTVTGTPLVTAVGSHLINIVIIDSGVPMSVTLELIVRFGLGTDFSVAWSPSPANVVVGQATRITATWSIARSAAARCVLFNATQAAALAEAGFVMVTQGVNAGDLNGTALAYRDPLFLDVKCRPDLNAVTNTLATNVTLFFSASQASGRVSSFTYEPAFVNLTACEPFTLQPIVTNYTGNLSLQFAFDFSQTPLFRQFAANNLNLNAATGAVGGSFVMAVMRTLETIYPTGVALPIRLYEINTLDASNKAGEANKGPGTNGGSDGYSSTLIASTAVAFEFHAVALNSSVNCELPPISLAKCIPGSVTAAGGVSVNCSGQMFMEGAELFITDLSVPLDRVQLQKPQSVQLLKAAMRIFSEDDCDTAFSFVAPTNISKGGEVRLTLYNPDSSTATTNNPTLGHYASSTIIFQYCFSGVQCYCGSLGKVYITDVDRNTGELISGPTCECDQCPDVCVESACRNCPPGAYCISGFMYPLPGWWSFNSRSAPGQCVITEACPGAVDANGVFREASSDGSINTQICAQPYTGAFCSSCIDDYFKDGDRCRPCPAGTNAFVLGFIYLVGMVALAACFAFLSDENLFRAVLVLLALQQLVVIGRTATQNLGSADGAARFFNTLGIFNFQIDFVSPECAVGNVHYSVIFFSTLVLIGIAAVLLLLAAVLRALLLFKWKLMTDRLGRNIELDGLADGAATSSAASSSRSLSDGGAKSQDNVDWLKYLKRRTVHSMVILLTIAYLQVATRVFEAIDCVDVDGEMRLVKELSTICYEGGNRASGITAWVLMIVYLVGFPAWAFYIVKRSFSKGAHDLKRAEKYGYLYRNLKDYAYWFRTLSYLINFSIALQSVLADNAALRLFLISTFLIFNSIMVASIWPFMTEFANYFPVVTGTIVPVVAAIFVAYQPQGEYRWRLFAALCVLIVLQWMVFAIVKRQRNRVVAFLTRVSGVAEMPRHAAAASVSKQRGASKSDAIKPFNETATGESSDGPNATASPPSVRSSLGPGVSRPTSPSHAGEQP